ncbi:hypothetical protein [Mycobacterium vicinigordonae]|uniref:Pyrrolo-quinoline quinone n=1 Tax=Mycobacterium vicinigordonae TaxID=1719132 RepID=A0A7D6E5V3_9MYCO|nr:hypothetical protein [Mycobacterium vicinigordonae]QLL06005.1 hypothetical protein H0P51_19770 [Mycobacterium vicinigordonae]
MIVVVVVTAVGAVLWWRMGGHGGGSGNGVGAAPKEAPIGTPKDRLIGFPLDRQPVVGWQLTAGQIGLPAGVPVGDLFAAVGDKAFFIAHNCQAERCTDPRGWVYGIDTRTGVLAFPLIPLDGFYGQTEDCALNGPSAAVCLNPDCEGLYFCAGRERVWVIDLERGAVKFSGPPQVHTHNSPGEPRLRAIGSWHGQTRLVAVTKGKGVYGVGERGELTWFVPGSGVVYESDHSQTLDMAPLTLGMQAADPLTGQGFRVFSVDGVDLTPTPPRGLNLSYAEVYNGGFAYEFRTQKDYNAGVALYDADGHQVALLPDASRPQPNPVMPSVLAGGGLQIYTAAGKLQTRLPSSGEHYQTIGTKLYLGGIDRWQQWDLLTGQPGPTCDMDFGVAYAGSDGATILTYVSGEQNHGATRAIDAANCQTRWEIPSFGGFPSLAKAGSALLQTTRDSIVGLRAPA